MMYWGEIAVERASFVTDTLMSVRRLVSGFLEWISDRAAARREKRKENLLPPNVMKRVKTEQLLMKENGMTYSNLSESNRAWLDSRISDMVSDD